MEYLIGLNSNECPQDKPDCPVTRSQCGGKETCQIASQDRSYDAEYAKNIKEEYDGGHLFPHNAFSPPAPAR
jgi:hypothetical protein